MQLILGCGWQISKLTSPVHGEFCKESIVSRKLFNRSAAALLILGSGCKSWSSDNYSLYNATRVPPPGTGTYQLPNGYYNNAAQPAAGQAAPVNAAPGANSAAAVAPNPIADTMPPTSLASATGSTPSVQTAQFTDAQAGTAGSSFAPANSSGLPSTGGMPATASGTPPAADLRWQQ